MFDVGFTELVLLFVIGLLILGPERLPRVAAQLGRWMGKARRTAHQLRMQLEREMTMSDIMRDKKDREQKKTESESTAADSSAEESYPEDEDANDSGHQDADSDATAAPEPVATASSDDKQSAANDSDSVQQRRA
jgi:sec-independent protein translocase protein TatB